MTALATTTTSFPRRREPRTRQEAGVATCVGPGLRRDDGSGEFMAALGEEESNNA